VADPACNTPLMGPGSKNTQEPPRASKPHVEAMQSLAASLGPVSPELALVDPILATRARELLPDPVEQTRRSLPRKEGTCATTPPVATPIAFRPPAPRSRTPRWRRTVVLAAITFAAGSASGGFLGGSTPVSPEAGSMFRAVPEIDGRAPSTELQHEQPPSAGRNQRSAASHAQGRPARRGIVHARETWATNVLGVTAGVDNRGVRITWRAPGRSDHVVVLRAQGVRSGGVAVFHGRATSFRDTSAERCSTYRYTIVNYDSRGRPSTGVPTSVVTQGCA
jgi:hypothetical protein